MDGPWDGMRPDNAVASGWSAAIDAAGIRRAETARSPLNAARPADVISTADAPHRRFMFPVQPKR
jgi:hypothetical protein